MTDLAVRVQRLSKQYRTGERESYAMLRDVLANGVRRSLGLLPQLLVGRPFESTPRAPGNLFWALDDVSFEVRQGEVLGIIGRNGAGKSALLKIIARITGPTRGRVEIAGRLAPLLEVGTGFHAELTGRENIYMSGAILGMKRAEIERKFDEIVSFAEIDQFIDTPVKRYSNGMYLRLAFAVAAHLEPEILLVDEVLAVGDAAFQKRCLGKMQEVAGAGKTILFVSHNMAAVRQLTRTAILLDQGKLVAYGSTGEVVGRYLSNVLSNQGRVCDLEGFRRRYPVLSREVEFVAVELEDCPSGLVPADADVRLRLTVRGNRDAEGLRFGITIHQLDGDAVGTVFSPQAHSLKQGEVATFGAELSDLRLAPDHYYCSMSVGRGSHLEERAELDAVQDVLGFEVLGPLRPDGVMSEWMSVWGPVRFKEPRVARVG